MKQFPRIDEIEELLQEEREQGNITKGLDKELIDELKNIKALDELIRMRIKRFVNSAIIAKYQHNEEEDAKIRIKQLEERMAHEWFESQVDRYYLERRDSYESVSFQLFRTESKGVAVETHQRLVEGEESWKEVSERWGLEMEKRTEGKYYDVKPEKMSKEIYNTLKRLKKGEISEPFRIGKHIGIVKLLNWKSVELNEELKGHLEKELLEEWMTENTQNTIKQLS